MFSQRVLRTSLLLLSCLLLTLYYPRAISAGQTEKTSVLLMYDSLAIGTPKEGNIEAIQRILASFGAQVTLTSYDRYEEGTLLKFDKVITIRNADDVTQIPEYFNRDMNEYDGEYMHIGNGLPTNVRKEMNIEDQLLDQDTIRLVIGQFSQNSITANSISYITKYVGTSYGQITSEKRKTNSPYGVLHGKFAYIPYMVKGNLSEQAAAYMLKDWLSVKTPSHNYVLFNEIYPFSDLDLLNEMADRMYDAGIPFLVSVQPVLNNLDFPIFLNLALLIAIVTYFTNVTTGLILNILFIFGYGTFTLYQTVVVGGTIGTQNYFWLIMTPLFTISTWLLTYGTRQLQLDNDQLRKANESLATVDAKTSLKNTFSFQSDATIFMALSVRYHIPLTLMVFSVKYWDEIRRIIGEEQLIEAVLDLSKMSQTSIRTNDSLYLLNKENPMWGMLLFTDRPGASIVIDRLRNSVEERNRDEYREKYRVELILKMGAIEYDAQLVPNPLEFITLAKKQLEFDV